MFGIELSFDPFTFLLVMLSIFLVSLRSKLIKA